MNRLFDKLLLCLYCLLAVSFHELDAGFVAAFFTVAALGCFHYSFNRKAFACVCTFLYGAASCFFPGLLLFLPVVWYDGLQFQAFVSLGMLALGLASNFGSFPVPLLFHLLLGIGISSFLEYKSSAFFKLEEQFRQMQDDSTERNLLLREKNKSLLEKQDYEIYTATLKERNRIAREIHDNVGHMLSRSILMVGALKTVNRQAPLTPPLDQLGETLSGAMDSIRRSVHDLHDDSVNLKETVESLTADFTKCPVFLEYDMQVPVPKEIKYSFIAILKESLSNIIKHSNATQVQVLLREHPGFYQLKIEDNGTAPTDVSGSGIGLLNMKERIQNLQGTLQISRNPGFRIFITVPKHTLEKQLPPPQGYGSKTIGGRF